MLVDAVIMHMASAAVALVLLVGAWQKLRDLMAFEIAVEAYELAPAALVKPLAILLPVTELCAAVLLLTPATRTLGAGLAVALLVFVTAAVVINLLRGRTDVGCGCGGIEDEQPLSWTLVTRNLVLALAAGSPFAYQARTLIWLDYLTIAAGAVCLYGLFVLTNQLVANQPRLAKLRAAA